MTAVTTAKLLELIGKSSATPPPGFHAVPADRLVLPIFEATPQQAPRIDYTAFYNPSTNELIISGQAKPFVQLKPGVNPEDGKDLGIFADATVRESVPVSQTVQLAQQLAHPVRGEYKNATVTFVGEGAAGLAFSATSHALRNDPNAQVSVGATVTLNAWRSTWTPDGSTDTGVLDIRTPNPANGDPTWINDPGARPGGVTLNVDTGNALLTGAVVGAATQEAADLLPSGVKQVASKIFGDAAGWAAEKAMGMLTDSMKGPASEMVANLAAGYVDRPERVIERMGWTGNLSAEDATRVAAGGISQGQWNVMHGKGPSGYGMDTTSYETAGNLVTVGVGPSAQQRQPAIQVTTYRDESTGAAMEVRLAGQLVDGKFEAGPTQGFLSGMDSAGRLVLSGAAAEAIAASQLTYKGGAAGAGSGDTDSSVGMLDEVNVTASGRMGYTTVSIQSHPNGTQSFEFTNEDGGKAYALQNSQTGGRSIIVTLGAEAEDGTKTIQFEVNKDGERVGVERHLDANGAELAPITSPQTPGTGPDVTSTDGGGGDEDWSETPSPPPPPPAPTIIRVNDNTVFTLNEDGDIVNEITTLGNGYTETKDIAGNVSYTDATGTVYTADQYQDQLSQSNDNNSSGTDYTAAAQYLSAAQALLSLGNFDDLSTTQQLGVLANLYNTGANLAGLPAIPGGATGLLSFIAALESGDAGAIVVAGAQFGAQGLSLYADLASNAADIAFQAGEWAVGEAALAEAAAANAGAAALAEAVPFLNLALALGNIEDNPMGVLAAGLAFVPGVGPILSLAVTIGGALLGDDGPDIAVGHIKAGWDDNGNLNYTTLFDQEEGARQALKQMTQLTQGLQDHLAKDGQYGLIPDALPELVITREPGGDDKHPYALLWTDDQGQQQSRYYDPQGNKVHHPETGGLQGPLWTGAQDQHAAEDTQFAQDFLKLAAHYAIAPASEVEKMRTEWVETIAQAKPLEAQAANSASWRIAA